MRFLGTRGEVELSASFVGEQGGRRCQSLRLGRPFEAMASGSA